MGRLRSVQRLAALAMTGCFRTTSTIAALALAGLLPAEMAAGKVLVQQYCHCPMSCASGRHTTKDGTRVLMVSSLAHTTKVHKLIALERAQKCYISLQGSLSVSGLCFEIYGDSKILVSWSRHFGMLLPPESKRSKPRNSPFFFCLRYLLYNATPQYTVSHFTVIVHIAKFWQLIGAVPRYISDLGYPYSF